MNPVVQRFLDEEGKVKQWPSKQAVKSQVMAYLVTKFEFDRDYREVEVNALLSSWHTFGDYFLLRRDMINDGWLCRLNDGSRYWRNPDKREDAPTP